MKLKVGSGYSRLYGADSSVIKRLSEYTSYTVEGHWFSPSFRNGAWDGKVRLLRKTSDGALKFPTGLSRDVLQVLKNLGKDKPEIEDARRPLTKLSRTIDWNTSAFPLRPYQEEAINVALQDRGALTGRGILKLPIRSGKTVVAAAIFQRLRARSAFIATSQLIHAQTVDLFRSALGSEWVGEIGDGKFDPNLFTVATIQRLQKQDALVKVFLRQQDVLVVDEVHHLQGDAWREPILEAPAMYKIGVSASVTLNRKLCERSAIWLKSATGPILIDVPMKKLVDDGYLVAPDIFMIECNRPTLSNARWEKAQRLLIIENDYRNRMIIEACGKLVEHGHLVLVDVGRLEHIKRLYSMAREANLNAAILYGDVKSSKRIDIRDRFGEDKIKVLIGTLLGEGVDIPKLSAVINAEGGESATSTQQRMRNLTAAPGKDWAVVVDFFDDTNRYLRKHSRARKKFYSKEEAFNFTGPMAFENFVLEIEGRSGI